MTTGYITHPDCLRHEMQPWHPECPARLWAVHDALTHARLFDLLRHYSAPKATAAALARVHETAYIETLLNARPGPGLLEVTADTWMNCHTVDAALRAAGSVLLAADCVLSGEIGNAFCNVRPPGHHALPGAAMGFCFFNNLAVGVAHAFAEHGIARVGILDFDAHLGNGSVGMFEADERVLICSVYQESLFPCDLTPPAPGRDISVPLHRGAGGDSLRTAVESRWAPALEAFEPQMLFISAGFDGHREDPLADLVLSERDYVWVSEFAVEVARRYARGRIVSVLEGGYALKALGRSAAAHVRVLMGI